MTQNEFNKEMLHSVQRLTKELRSVTLAINQVALLDTQTRLQELSWNLPVNGWSSVWEIEKVTDNT